MTKNRKVLKGVLLAFLLAMGGGAHTAKSAPVNDAFANRVILSGSSISFTGTLVGATSDGFESSITNWPSINSPSVWWEWTAPQSSTVVMSLSRDYSVLRSEHSYLVVLTGTATNNLSSIAGTLLDAPAGRNLRFSATAGKTYKFMVAGFLAQSFTIQLDCANSPVFVIQPSDCVVSRYGSAFFGALASGTGPSATDTQYQWKFNGVPIGGQIYPSLLIHNVSQENVGQYSVVAASPGGSTQSRPVQLTLSELDPVPSLLAGQPSDDETFAGSLKGAPGGWYRLESSPDIQDWNTTNWLQATDITNAFSLPRLGPNHFVRAAINTATDVCVGQLKQLFWAQNAYLIVSHKQSVDTVTLFDLEPYAPTAYFDGLAICPEGGYYQADFGEAAIKCSITGRGHEIPAP
jgi:hypothetical protein